MESTLTAPGAVLARLQPETARAGSAQGRGVARGLAAEEFDDIVRAHQRRIYRVLLGLVGDADTAESLTQECFLRAYQSRRQFRGEANVGTWLVRIAVNLATDHHRNRKNAFWRRLFGASNRGEATAVEVEALADSRASPEREFAAREQLEAVWSAVNALSPQQRAVFVLRFAEEMSLEEIAQAMALEIGTVKAHLARATDALRKQLKERGQCKLI